MYQIRIKYVSNTYRNVLKKIFEIIFYANDVEIDIKFSEINEVDIIDDVEDLIEVDVEICVRKFVKELFFL